MTFQENNTVEQKDPVKQEEKVETQSAEVKAATPEEEVQQQNWKKFREKREEERKAREQAEKMAAEEKAKVEAMKAAMEALLNRQQPHQPQEQYQEDESEDQRIQKKVEAAIEARIKREEYLRKEQEKASLPEKLNASIPDFDKVCSTNNLDYLEYHYPEITAGYKNMPDSYEKWQNIYKAVKRFVPNTDMSKEQKKLDNNMKKPQSLSAASTLESTTGKTGPNILSEEKRAENWARMQRTINKLD